MLLDGVYFKNDVTEHNMKALSDTQAKIMEQRICELAELAEDAAAAAGELIAEGYGIYEILGILSDGVSFGPRMFISTLWLKMFPASALMPRQLNIRTEQCWQICWCHDLQGAG